MGGCRGVMETADKRRVAAAAGQKRAGEGSRGGAKRSRGVPVVVVSKDSKRGSEGDTRKGDGRGEGGKLHAHEREEGMGMANVIKKQKQSLSVIPQLRPRGRMPELKKCVSSP